MLLSAARTHNVFCICSYLAPSAVSTRNSCSLSRCRLRRRVRHRRLRIRWMRIHVLWRRQRAVLVWMLRLKGRHGCLLWYSLGDWWNLLGLSVSSELWVNCFHSRKFCSAMYNDSSRAKLSLCAGVLRLARRSRKCDSPDFVLAGRPVRWVAGLGSDSTAAAAAWADRLDSTGRSVLDWGTFEERCALQARHGFVMMRVIKDRSTSPIQTLAARHEDRC